MSKIITSSDLSAYLNKTLQSGVAGQVAAAINDWVETRTKRCWGETRTVTERYNWARQLWLRHQDVQSVGGIMLGWPGQNQYSIQSNSYWFNSFGRITLFFPLIGPIGGINNTSMLLNDYMEVTYTYGVTTVPDDLKMAALGVAAGFYSWAINGGQNVVAASVGTYKLEYAGRIRQSAGTKDPAMNTADAGWEVIDSYKTQRV